MPIDFNALMKSVEDSRTKANAANLERYNQLLASLDALMSQVTGAGGTFGQAQQLMEQIGGAAKQQIADQTLKAQASASQDLVSRGLTNTTVTNAVQRGIQADTAKALQAQAEGEAAQKAGLLTQRAGVESQLGLAKASAIENMTQAGPDLGLFASLLQAAAATDNAQTKRTATIAPAITNPTAGRYSAGATLGGSGSPGGLSPSGGGGNGGDSAQVTTYGTSQSWSPVQTSFGSILASVAGSGNGGIPNLLAQQPGNAPPNVQMQAPLTASEANIKNLLGQMGENVGPGSEPGTKFGVTSGGTTTGPTGETPNFGDEKIVNGQKYRYVNAVNAGGPQWILIGPA